MHHTKTKLFQHSHHLVHDFSRAELCTRIVIGIAFAPSTSVAQFDRVNVDTRNQRDCR